MLDVKKFKGLVGVAIGVAVAVAGALNAPDVAEQLQAVGVSADEAITAVVGLVSAVTVVVGALSEKLGKKPAPEAPAE